VILKNSAKKIAKKLAFLTQNKAKLYKILIISLVFEKNANFFAENCQKSQKIVILIFLPKNLAKIYWRFLTHTTYPEPLFWYTDLGTP
jgi:hypothetical protein